MQSEQEYRLVGVLSKPHGIRGGFHVQLSSDFPEWVAQRKILYAEIDGSMVPWTVIDANFSGKRLVFRVDALSDRSAVEASRGTALHVPESEARELVSEDPNYFYNSDLIGLRLVDSKSGEDYGRVDQVIEMPGQNLLEITQADGNSFLFPFTAGLVEEVLLDKGEIQVRMPAGLIEITGSTFGSIGETEGVEKRGRGGPEAEITPADSG